MNFFTTVTSALDTTYLDNETSHRQTKMLVSICSVSPKTWPSFRDFWLRNGSDQFAHCDPPPALRRPLRCKLQP